MDAAAEIKSLLVNGTPQGKGRPRFAYAGGLARVYTPAKTKKYEAQIAAEYLAKYSSEPKIKGALVLHVVALFAKPKSWPKSRRDVAKWHTGKPDADNIIKVVGDALNGIAWEDDSQIAKCIFIKKYTDAAPCLEIKITAGCDYDII